MHFVLFPKQGQGFKPSAADLCQILVKYPPPGGPTLKYLDAIAACEKKALVA